MAVEEYTWVEPDNESPFLFFYCRLCPLTIPFLAGKVADSYRRGHELNAYHKRRLEQLR
jgi:hypothetical protein